LKTTVPPPLLTLIFAGLMALLNLLLPWQIVLPFKLFILSACAFVAMILLGESVLRFIRSKTTVNPLRPEKASSLVVAGVFRLSRNPMYLGMLLLLCSVAIYLDNPANIILIAGYVLVMNELQIKPEEQALQRLFGEDYITYCSRVRRWI
jgi:protein-S-isoprenylcysteine O-methyltransferase Ste14